MKRHRKKYVGNFDFNLLFFQRIVKGAKRLYDKQLKS